MERDLYALIDPKQPLPCSLGVVARQSRLEALARIEQEGKERTFVVRAILSDHVPLAGSVEEILERPSHRLLGVNEEKLTIYLHHGGRNAVFFDLVGSGPHLLVDHIDVQVLSRYPGNCFWAARSAVSHLLDSLMGVQWLPLTIRRLDLHLEGEDVPLCHQLILPFTDGIQLGPLGGIHQFAFLSAYEAMVREAVTTSSPFYRLLCAYRLYEGINPLRKTLRELAARLETNASLPKPPAIDLELLKAFGFTSEFTAGVKNTEDFWKKTTDMRNGVAHFLLNDSPVPVSMSNGGVYHEYSLVGAVLLHYSYLAFRDLKQHISTHFTDKLQRGSVLPEPRRRGDFVLRPDTPEAAR